MDSKNAADRRLDSAKTEISQATALAGQAARDTAEAGKLEMDALMNRVNQATTPSATWSDPTNSNWNNQPVDNRPLSTVIGDNIHNLENRLSEATTPSSTTATSNANWNNMPVDNRPLTTVIGEGLHSLEDKIGEASHSIVEGLMHMTGMDQPSTTTTTGLDNTRLDNTRVNTGLFGANSTGTDNTGSTSLFGTSTAGDNAERDGSTTMFGTSAERDARTLSGVHVTPGAPGTPLDDTRTTGLYGTTGTPLDNTRTGVLGVDTTGLDTRRFEAGSTGYENTGSISLFGTSTAERDITGPATGTLFGTSAPTLDNTLPRTDLDLAHTGIDKPIGGTTIDTVKGTDRPPSASPDPFKWQPENQ